MDFAAKLERWIPLHRNGASRWAHFVGGYLFVFAVLVPSFLAAAEVGGVTVSAAALVVLAVAALQLRLDLFAGAVSALLLVPTYFAAQSAAALPLTGALGVAGGVMVFRFAGVIAAHVLLEKKTHGLELGGPVLFLTEPAYVVAFALVEAGWHSRLKAKLTRR